MVDKYDFDPQRGHSTAMNMRGIAPRSAKERLNLALTEEDRKRLDHCMELSGVKTQTELITRAIKLFEWAIEEQQVRRREILVRDPGGEPRIVRL